MSLPSDEITVERKIVLFFDICSSTAILEDLVRTENQKLWRDLLIDMKKYLRAKQSSVDFEMYKFLGDGWVLLFDPQPKGLKMLKFIESLSDKFTSLYKNHLENVLTTQIPIIGLTFGMDVGSCIRFIMNGKSEYTGRPLNVAARLQSAIGQRDSKPQNKLLLSNNLYATFEDKAIIEEAYRVKPVPRVLKNIAGGDKYRCRKVWLK